MIIAEEGLSRLHLNLNYGIWNVLAPETTLTPPSGGTHKFFNIKCFRQAILLRALTKHILTVVKLEISDFKGNNNLKVRQNLQNIHY